MSLEIDRNKFKKKRYRNIKIVLCLRLIYGMM